MADNYSEISVDKTSVERNAAKQMGISGFTAVNYDSEELKVKDIPATEA